MKGDFVSISYRIPTGMAVEKVQADRDGSEVAVKMPDRNELFIKVEVVNKAGTATKTCRFAATEVLAITEGHEKLARKKK